MAYVLDASIAACWYFNDEQDERADKALYLLGTDRALAPLHWWFEVRNLTLLGERRKHMSEQATTEFLGRLGRLPIDIVEFSDPGAVLSLARHHYLTFYDAAYLELAKRRNVPLATLDKQLLTATRAEGITIIE